MPNLRLRFQKFDKYQNSIFICSSTKEDEKESYDTLKKYYEKIYETTDTFLPIYDSLEYNYATIRFKKNMKKHNNLTQNYIYQVDFTIKKAERESKIYYNCFTTSIKLLEKAKEIDYGDEIEL
jgi:uncharacterized protein YktB (UPF0637 family)